MKRCALENMKLISSTLPVSQRPMGWLKEVPVSLILKNILCMLATRETFQAEMSALKRSRL